MLERRMRNSMEDRAICLLDNIYYLRDACYMAIECLVAFPAISTDDFHKLRFDGPPLRACFVVACGEE